MKYKFVNEAEVAELKIYDEIDSWCGFSTRDLEDKLNEANGKALNVYINSNGGEVFEGFAIYNILKRYSGYKTIYIDGLAASIASVIALAGNKLIMNKASMMMIHNASGCCFGNAEDMKKVVQALEQINSVIRGIYIDKTGLNEEKITELMDNETFMTSQECLDYGFCDEIIEDKQTPEQLEVTNKAMESLKNSIEERIKTLNSLKEVSQAGGKDSVSDEGTFFNKESKGHWNWLEKGIN